MFSTSYENKYMAKKTTLVICLNKAFLEKKVRMQKRGMCLGVSIWIHSKAQGTKEISLKIKPRWYIKCTQVTKQYNAVEVDRIQASERGR